MRTAGPATVATRTLRTTTSATVAAREASSEPGTTKKATPIESSRVLPANAVVRPAVRRVVAAASDRGAAGGELLAEAGEHQQGVVDPQRQAHHRADGQREGVDVEPAGEEVEDAAGGGDRGGAEDEGDRRGDRRAEDEQEDEEEDRQRDQLAALGGGDRFVLDLAGEGRVAGLGGPDRRPDVLFEDRVELVDRVVDGIRQVDVEVGDDQGLARPRAQALDGAAVPGRERRHLRVGGAQGPDQPRALDFDRAARAAEEDREGRRVAEVFVEDPGRRGGGGAGNVERGRAEPTRRRRGRGSSGRGGSRRPPPEPGADDREAPVSSSQAPC